MPSIASERLRSALKCWKDACWWQESIMRAVGNGRMPAFHPDFPPQIYHWRKFEELVFDNTVISLKHSEWSPVGKLSVQPEFADAGTFPFEFFTWSRKSRRVFHLPEGLWSMFTEATYPTIRWEDVLLPFESFVITLEGTPLRRMFYEGGEGDIDTLLVTSSPDGLTIRPLCCVPAADAARYPLESVQRRFEIQLRRRTTEELIKWMDDKLEEWREQTWSHTTPCTTRISSTVMAPKSRVLLEPTDFLETMRPEEKAGHKEGTWGGDILLPLFSDTAKIVVGWCLYLQSLSNFQLSWKREKEKKVTQKRGRRGVTGIITEINHICTVLGQARLDPASYGLREPLTQNSGLFKRPHWRRAHYARPRGSRPTDPKSLKIPPLLIRKDLVPLFGIISGTKTEVLEDE